MVSCSSCSLSHVAQKSGYNIPSFLNGGMPPCEAGRRQRKKKRRLDVELFIKDNINSELVKVKDMLSKLTLCCKSYSSCNSILFNEHIMMAIIHEGVVYDASRRRVSLALCLLHSVDGRLQN
ncbi:hypothetical protein NQ317_012665 [Molorchus minor]|uniref:Uncharacterized protein n=1 Tax=Molorchus minor TaxID=1323400 RepID=A0ABQ9ITT2_9CUCU|nr:hypothetical protein NQ317_012665 [Molorchus minor]